jgi:hypothetical protein
MSPPSEQKRAKNVSNQRLSARFVAAIASQPNIVTTFCFLFHQAVPSVMKKFDVQ